MLEGVRSTISQTPKEIRRGLGLLLPAIWTENARKAAMREVDTHLLFLSHRIEFSVMREEFINELVWFKMTEDLNHAILHLSSIRR